MRYRQVKKTLNKAAMHHEPKYGWSVMTEKPQKRPKTRQIEKYMDWDFGTKDWRNDLKESVECTILNSAAI
jgi:hypothetical protein